MSHDIIMYSKMQYLFTRKRLENNNIKLNFKKYSVATDKNYLNP